MRTEPDPLELVVEGGGRILRWWLATGVRDVASVRALTVRSVTATASPSEHHVCLHLAGPGGIAPPPTTVDDRGSSHPRARPVASGDVTHDPQLPTDRPRRRRRVRVGVSTAVAAVVLAGCGADDTDVADLEAEVEQLRADRSTTLERFDELEADLDRMDELSADIRRLERELSGQDDVEQRLETADEQLEGLTERLGEIDDELESGDADLTAVREELAGATEQLQGEVASTQSSVEDVRGEVEELRTLYTTLRDRLDRLQRGD